MPIKSSRYGQSIFDMVCEGFGTLDNLIDVAVANRISISGNLQVNTQLQIDTENLGEDNIKKAISNQGLKFNNNYVPLSTLTWDSTAITWDSTEVTFDQV